MTDQEMYKKLNQLKATSIASGKYETAEALEKAINTLKIVESSHQDDIIIRIQNEDNKEEKAIAKIVFRSSGLQYNISEKEMTGCYVKDIDSYNDNEVTYKIVLNKEQ